MRNTEVNATFSRRFLPVAALMGVLLVGATCGPTDQIAISHVEADVPPAENFSTFLQRDLAKYFSNNGINVATVKFEMLREEATQSGIASPKFCVWVWTTDATGVTVKGAVRLAAIDRIRFEVTHYLSQQAIAANTASIDTVFPTDVCEKIRERIKTESR